MENNNDRQIAESIEQLFRLMNRWMKLIYKSYFLRKGSVDITPNQYRVLFALKNYGPSKMSEFGEYVHTSCGSLTVMVDRLVEKGFVERFYLPEDRRLVMVKITPMGEKILEEFREGFLNLLMENINRLNADETKNLSKAIDELTAFVKDKFIG